MPLATVMRSGTMPSCSTPTQRPVRPQPVMTSSAIISTSSSSQIARTARSQPSGGMMNPPDESTGSMITAETVSAPSSTIASLSSLARRCTSCSSVPAPRSRNGYGRATFVEPAGCSAEYAAVLLGRGLGDRPGAVAGVAGGAPGAAGQQPLAVLRPHPHALGPIDDELLVGEPRVVLRLVGPQMADRFGSRRHRASSPGDMISGHA